MPTSQQTQDVEAMLVWRWSSVVDGGSTLNQHCFNVLCQLGWFNVSFLLGYEAEKQSDLSFSIATISETIILFKDTLTLSPPSTTLVFFNLFY